MRRYFSDASAKELTRKSEQAHSASGVEMHASPMKVLDVFSKRAAPQDTNAIRPMHGGGFSNPVSVTHFNIVSMCCDNVCHYMFVCVSFVG